MRSLHIAGTGMMAQQTNVEVISNNIANMNTTGYKRRRAEFQDLLYQNLRRSGSQSAEEGTVLPSGAQVGLGAVAVRLTVIGKVRCADRVETEAHRHDESGDNQQHPEDGSDPGHPRRWLQAASYAP